MALRKYCLELIVCLFSGTNDALFRTYCLFCCLLIIVAALLLPHNPVWGGGEHSCIDCLLSMRILLPRTSTREKKI